MRLVGPATFGGLLVLVFAGCATGSAADDTSTADSGPKHDSSTTDSGPVKDSAPPKDSGGTVDTGGGNCGSGCLGLASTCCNGQCVDITSDPNNCGGCGNPSCGTQSCCAGNCVDTMGSDTSNCGGCGIPCNGICSNGTCQTQGGSCTLDKGSCSHSPCTTGGALTDGCDPEYVTSLVCDVDGLSYCCSSSWDSSCVSDASYWEANSCIGQGC
jgi:hypothetical protein